MTEPVIKSVQVIENVRRSLERASSAKQYHSSKRSQRPPIYEARRSGSVASEIDLFLSEVENLSGVGKKYRSVEIGSALKALVAEQNIGRATVWDTACLREMAVAEVLHSLGIELVSPNASKHEMALCDLGITEADYFLPETGTIVLRSSAEMPRAVSLLPRMHLAILHPEMLRADMHQVFSEAKDSHYLVFISGPSRTADIELTVTLGVHGPKQLFVWMVEE